MGIIGFVATIPGTLCAGCMGACASAAETVATGHSSGLASFWILINLASAGAGLYFGVKSKSAPRTSGAVMIGVATLTLLLSFITLNWFWGLIAVACFGIGGAISLTQEKLPVPGQAEPPQAAFVQPPPAAMPTQKQMEAFEESEKTIAPPPVPAASEKPAEPEPVAPPPVQNFSANQPAQHYASASANEEIVSARRQAETKGPDNKSATLLIWGLVGAAFLLIAVVLVMEFMPSGKGKAVTQGGPDKKTETATKAPHADAPAPSAGALTESEVSIGYVKTLTGSTLRMRKEPSEEAPILLNIPNGSPVIILGYDEHTTTVKGETGKWCKIKYTGETGWAWGKFIVQK